jgi:hypothetical protein
MMKIVSVIALLFCVSICQGFGITSRLQVTSRISVRTPYVPLFAEKEDGVIELVDAEEEEKPAESKAKDEGIMAPFLSQGEIQPESLTFDVKDPKQTRVIIYIILSLLPVLFLIPLMLGSREFLPALIPMDELPPVEL